MNESRHIQAVLLTTEIDLIARRLSHVTHEWVTSHMNESRHIRAVLRTTKMELIAQRMSHVTNKTQQRSRHIQIRHVGRHIQIRHVGRHIQIRHVPREWVMSLTNEAFNLQMVHVPSMWCVWSKKYGWWPRSTQDNACRSACRSACRIHNACQKRKWSWSKKLMASQHKE